MEKLLLKAWMFVCINTFVFGQQNVSIETPLGSMKGVVKTVLNETVFQFRKIPFAKAPVGQLRFQKPVSYGSWNNSLDATTFGPSCMQSMKTLPSNLPNNNVSEDCLYLNIYIPRNLSKSFQRSVIIWVHGGAYVVGQAMAYDGSYLALSGDVIVVTINYRLGMFGFLSFGGSHARGNYGLWDQQMAFKWVHTNIGSFGGNPSSVTIFGESAGGLSIGLQSLHAENKGLFNRVIEDSGVANSFITYSRDYLQLVNAIGNLLNCGNLTTLEPPSYLQCLIGKSANEIQNAMDTLTTTFTTNVELALPVGPVIDGDFLQDDPVRLLQNKSSKSYSFFKSLDIITGTMTAEGSLLLIFTRGYQSIFNFNLTQGIPTTFLCNQMAPALARSFYNNNQLIATAICNKYKVANGNDVNLAQQSRNVVNMYGDVYFVSAAVQYLNFHSAGNTQSKSYQFLFSAGNPFPNPRTPAWFQGAKHSSELAYLFGLQDTTSVQSGYLNLSNAMLKYWTNFAKTGNPNGDSLPQWPEYNPTSKYYLNLDRNITLGQDLYRARVNFWLKILPDMLNNNSTGDTSTTPSGQPRSHSVTHSSTTTGNHNSAIGLTFSTFVMLFSLKVLVFLL